MDYFFSQRVMVVKQSFTELVGKKNQVMNSCVTLLFTFTSRCERKIGYDKCNSEWCTLRCMMCLLCSK